MTDTQSYPSFSRSLNVEKLDAEPHEVTLDAEAADAPAIAAFLGILGVEKLHGDAKLTRHRALIEITGHIDAVLTRECVATLEPMTEVIEEPFFVAYTTQKPDADDADEEVEIDLDAPEYLPTNLLDVGSVFLEQVVLAMAPHPRKEGAEAIVDPGAGASVSPFSVLKDLKPGTKE